MYGSFLLLTLPWLIVALLLQDCNGMPAVDTGRNCPAGTFDTGSQCRKCPQGSFSDTPNSFQCKRCPFPQTSDEGASSESQCRFCGRGNIFARTALKGVCRVCPVDTFSDKMDATECTPCPSGTVSRVRSWSAESCTVCEPGRVVDRRPGAPLTCMTCPEGQSTFTKNAETCSDCPAGEFRPPFRAGRRAIYVEGKCWPCPPGSFSDKPGATACKECPINTFQNEFGATRCKRCPPRSSFPRKGGVACFPSCMPGSPGCNSCPGGEGFNVQKRRCEACPPNFVSPGLSSTPCVMCPPGDSMANPEKTKCVCMPGFFALKDGRCMPCPSGKSSPDGGGCMCDVMGTADRFCSCPPGTKEKENKCMPCNVETDSSCTGCSFGEIFNETTRKCERCPANTFKSSSRGNTCLPCPEGSTSRPGSFACTCPPGQGLVAMGNTCEPCPPGTSSSSGISTSAAGRRCEKCPTGFANGVFGATRCTRCPEGLRTSGTGATECKICPPNSTARTSFLGNRQRCECNSGFINTAAPGSDPVCEKCGLNEEVRGRRCVCQSKLFGGPNNDTCIRCPPNTFTDSNGGCNCFSGFQKVDNRCERIRCEPGFAFRIDKCERCPVGDVSGGGTNFCRTCPDGQEPFEGRKCLPTCPFRSFRNADEECQSCTNGQRVLNRTCVNCEGSVSNGGDVGFCTPCTNGKIPNRARNACIDP